MKKLASVLLFLISYLGAEVARIEAHFIDVGQGDAILIRCFSESRTYDYLIDAGKDLASDKVLNYLSDAGVDTLAACLLSHPDYDHYGEFSDLIRDGRFTVLKFIKNQDGSTATSYSTLIGNLNSHQIPIQTVSRGSALNWAVATEVLSPDLQVMNGWSENERSIVVRLHFGEYDFLFTGDSETRTNNYNIANNTFPAHNILKVAHHGSFNGTDFYLLDALRPICSIISSGNNSYGHPNQNVVYQLESFMPNRVFSTADDYSTWDQLPNADGSADTSLDDDIIISTDGNLLFCNDEPIFQVGTEEEILPQPAVFCIYPNPFNPATTLSFDLAKDSEGIIDVYNVRGQKVETIAARKFERGKNLVTWRPKASLGNGIYFVRLSTKNGSIVKKAILLK